MEPTPTSTRTQAGQRPELIAAPESNLAPAEIEVRIDRDALKIKDLRFMARIRRMQLAGLRGEPLPADYVTDDELYAFWDRVIIGGSAAIEELPLAAVAQVWETLDQVITGRSVARRDHEKNS